MGREYRFQFKHGDVVLVDGYGEQTFLIDFMTTNVFHYKNEEPVEEITYTCKSTTDQHDFVEAYEEDLILFQTAETYKLTQNSNSTSQPSKSKKQKKKEPSVKEIVNELLDKLNDYKLLYETFGDRQYKACITNTLKKLNELAQNK